jgi:CRISPR/Cas system CSM-associated protein Csm4 (group 5 of RAMP superfamily)
MNPAFLVRFRPTGPWRIGPDSGARDRTDSIYHSDTLFSAVTLAMASLGGLDEWLGATARAGEPAVRFSSCFPYIEDMNFVVPPRSAWPPAPSAKVRWSSARFVPLTVVAALLAEHPLDDDAWRVDGPSGCLMPAEGPYQNGPFRTSLRAHAAVDRVRGSGVEVHRTACLEFAPGAGLWAVASFAGAEAEARWKEPVKAALRLLADTGMGGERSLGWGRSAAPGFVEGVLPDIVLPSVIPPAPAETAPEGEAPARSAPEMAWWLLSLFSPGPQDAVDWQRGSYSVVNRGGRVESPARSGVPKKPLPMVEEGSVLVAQAPPRGAAPDVGPDGFPHPVLRAGFAVAIPVPLRQPVGAS